LLSVTSVKKFEQRLSLRERALLDELSRVEGLDELLASDVELAEMPGQSKVFGPSVTLTIVGFVGGHWPLRRGICK
jgi:hypothetical protein